MQCPVWGNTMSLQLRPLDSTVQKTVVLGEYCMGERGSVVAAKQYLQFC